MINFLEAVQADIKYAYSPMSSELRKPENLEEWYECLKKIDADIMTQLQAAKLGDRVGRNAIKSKQVTREEGHRQLDEREEWRKRAVHKRRYVTERIRECKQLMREAYPIDRAVFDQLDRLRETAERLREAIMAHQAATEAAEIEPEPHDEELWRAVTETEHRQ